MDIPVSIPKLMNILNSAACLATAMLFSASLHAAPVKVFLLAGQSNMRGMGKPAELKSPYTESPATVKIWEGKSWAPLVAKGDQFGPEIAFGHAMPKQMPNEEIRLIKHAVSGTNLHTHWAPSIIQSFTFEPSGSSSFSSLPASSSRNAGAAAGSFLE